MPGDCSGFLKHQRYCWTLPLMTYIYYIYKYIYILYTVVFNHPILNDKEHLSQEVSKWLANGL